MPVPTTGVRTAQKNTQGGFWSASIFSGNAVLSGALTAAPLAVGTGYDVLLFSGPGRLDSIMAHQPMQSGQAIYFYDAGAVSSGGPFVLSGHKIVGIYPPTWRVPTGVAVASGQTNFVDSQPGIPIAVAQPFQSGLCVALKSGQPGFSAFWTPEQPAGQ